MKTAPKNPRKAATMKPVTKNTVSGSLAVSLRSRWTPSINLIAQEEHAAAVVVHSAVAAGEAGGDNVVDVIRRDEKVITVRLLLSNICQHIYHETPI